MKERILIIKLGALGDLVLCFQAFAAIRAYHPDAEIALLTGPAFAAFGLQMPWIDVVIRDPRPRWYQLTRWIKLIRDLRRFAPTRVYDFQGKPRQKILYYALGKPDWSGAVKGCRFPRFWPPVKGMHYTEFLAAQMAAVFAHEPDESRKNAVSSVAEAKTDVSWLDGPLDAFSLPEKYAVLIPSCSPQHPHKKWPAALFAALAKRLAQKGISSVAIGTKGDKESIDDIRTFAPEVIDLSGQTSLGQVAAIARQAVCVVGNDTGPTHLAAAVGAKTVALLSDHVDPLWSSPKGPRASWIGGRPMTTITVDEVEAAALRDGKG
ncbi:MAG: glycosyltransferase family 9 protein [Bdellovibrionales bacterium]